MSLDFQVFEGLCLHSQAPQMTPHRRLLASICPHQSIYIPPPIPTRQFEQTKPFEGPREWTPSR